MRGEVKHHNLVGTCILKQADFLVGPGKQSGLPFGRYDCQRVSAKSDGNRAQSLLMSFVGQTADEKPMAEMHTVKHPYCGHAAM